MAKIMTQYVFTNGEPEQKPEAEQYESYERTNENFWGRWYHWTEECKLHYLYRWHLQFVGGRNDHFSVDFNNGVSYHVWVELGD